MRRFKLLALMAAITVAGFPASLRAEQPLRERAVVEFSGAVKMYDVILNGRYLILHNDDKMAQGEPCLYVFRQSPGKADKLITAFHCRPIARERTDTFKVTFSRSNSPYDIPEVREIQFPGMTKAHQTP